MGVLEAMFEALAREADRDWLMIDSDASGYRSSWKGRTLWGNPASACPIAAHR